MGQVSNWDWEEVRVASRFWGEVKQRRGDFGLQHFEVRCTKYLGRDVKAYIYAYSPEQAEGKAEGMYPGCASYQVIREY